jgi:CysZ protein
MISLIQKGNNPFYVLGCWIKGFQFLTKAPLRQFLLIPIMINLLLYSLAFGLVFFYRDALAAYLLPNWIRSMFWLAGLSTLLTGLIFISIILIAFFSFTLLANLIAAPFYGKLSERTVNLLIDVATDKGEVPNSVERPPEILWRSYLYAEWLRVRYLLSWLLLLLIISFIPVINLISPILWTLFAAWGMALEYLSYPLENQGLLFSEQKKFAKNVRLGALTFGGISLVALIIPIVNIFMSPVAVIAATIYTHNIQQKKNVVTINP